MNEQMEAIFQEQRPFLLGLAMRILGGCADAEDIVQEAFLRWKSVDIREIDSPKAYLTTILTRLCLNYLSSARNRREILVDTIQSSSFEPWQYSPEGDLADALSDALDALLAQLSPNERVVFMLREAFEFSYDEVARIVGLSSDNCRQLSKRARDHISRREVRFAPNPAQEERALHTFLSACQTGDFSALIAALSEDVELCKDSDDERFPAPAPLVGRDVVAEAISTLFAPGTVGSIEQEIFAFGNQTILFQHVEHKRQRAIMIRVDGEQIRGITVIKCPLRLRRMRLLLSGSEAGLEPQRRFYPENSEI
jgi:RNA polymerase sigma-70 factor (ECF subfamily)